MSLFWNFESVVSKVSDANAAASAVSGTFFDCYGVWDKERKKTLLEEWKRSACLPPCYLKLEIETHLQQPFSE